MRRYKKEDEINHSIAHMELDGKFFQVLNDAGDDWDEAETVKQFEAWKSNQWLVKLSGFFGVKEDA